MYGVGGKLLNKIKSMYVNSLAYMRVGRGCVDQIFTIKQIGDKAREKKGRVCVGFMNLEKAYDRVNKEALWRVMWVVNC